MLDSDLILIDEFLSGDVSCFEAIVEKYHAPVYRLAYKFAHNADDAEDVAQETFIRAYESLMKKNSSEGMLLKPWLMTICVNLCRNLAKKKKNFNFSDLEREEEDDSLVERLQGREPSPRDQVLQQEVVGAVQEAVKHLPAKYQLVIDLRYIQDLSYEEIAEVLQVPLNTVKVHLNRAKKALKFYLSPL